MRIHPALIGTRVAVIGVLAVFAAGCADTHIGSDPFYTPFGSRDKDTTGSVATPRAVPTGQVSSRPLPPPYYPPASVPAANGETRVPTHATLPPPPEHTRWPRSAASSSGYDPPATVAARPAPSMARTPPTVVAPSRTETTGAVPVGAGAADQWSWNGGKAIIVQPGETLALLARRHAVPLAAIMRANNLSHPAVIRPGQRLVIPAYTYRPGSTAAERAPQVPVATAHGATTSHVVNSGETLHALARRYKTTPAALAAANGLSPNARLTVGQKLIVPGGPLASVAAPQPTRPAEPAPRRAETRPEPANDADGPTSSVAAGKPTKPEADTAEVGELRPGMSFRWPVRGRVIATFGSKPGGERNDGINIAVPEGASIKAAEDGTVAYAGSELKGYGNLVLLRHANGWVTAYAHNSEILVRRGDSVKRGQIISRSGQTGSVNSPQLHFEIRRGSNPVDPMPMLTGG